MQCLLTALQGFPPFFPCSAILYAPSWAERFPSLFSFPPFFCVCTLYANRKPPYLITKYGGSFFYGKTMRSEDAGDPAVHHIDLVGNG